MAVARFFRCVTLSCMLSWLIVIGNDLWPCASHFLTYGSGLNCVSGGPTRLTNIRLDKITVNIGVYREKKTTGTTLPLYKQEAQLMLTNLRDAFGGQSRSPNILPFHTLVIVSYCAIVTLSLRRAVLRYLTSKNVLTLKWGQRSHNVIESGIIR